MQAGWHEDIVICTFRMAIDKKEKKRINNLPVRLLYFILGCVRFDVELVVKLGLFHHGGRSRMIECRIGGW